MKITPYSCKHQRGVTLLENMVALLVLSVGLLGLAGLQAYTMRSGTGSTARMYAIQQAHDMADRIRANMGGIYANNPPTAYTTITPTASPTVVTNCNLAACTPPQLALFDEFEWHKANNRLLSGDHNVVGGYVTATPILNTAGAPIYLYPDSDGNPLLPPNPPSRMRYTVTMWWDADRTGGTSADVLPVCNANNTSKLKCYSVVVDL